MSCGVGQSHGSDPKWLWLWLAAATLIQPLAQELAYAAGAAKKKKKKKVISNDNKIRTSLNFFFFFFWLVSISDTPPWLFGVSGRGV